LKKRHQEKNSGDNLSCVTIPANTMITKVTV